MMLKFQNLIVLNVFKPSSLVLFEYGGTYPQIIEKLEKINIVLRVPRFQDHPHKLLDHQGFLYLLCLGSAALKSSL